MTDSGRPLRILHVAGARPNFMKVAPVLHAIAAAGRGHRQWLVHTGQHYDADMSRVFFGELGLPEPDVNLAVGSSSHARQTAEIMIRFEPVMLELAPDWVVVVGDVNSTLACALVAAKLGTRVAHVEAGLRSGDVSMPEEINRLLTDRIADRLYTPSRDADENLLREGVAPDRIRFVGNVMVDSLMRLAPRADERWPRLRDRLGVTRFALVTLHRPANVDDEAVLREVLAALTEISHGLPVVFPVHPRTRARLAGVGFEASAGRIELLDPLGYLDFLALESRAQVVLTDSGGVQEETTMLGVPCLTLRDNTERPITIRQGTNRLVARDKDAILAAVASVRGAPTSRGDAPELWDGRAGERIAADLLGDA